MSTRSAVGQGDSESDFRFGRRGRNQSRPNGDLTCCNARARGLSYAALGRVFMGLRPGDNRSGDQVLIQEAAAAAADQLLDPGALMWRHCSCAMQFRQDLTKLRRTVPVGTLMIIA